MTAEELQRADRDIAHYRFVILLAVAHGNEVAARADLPLHKFHRIEADRDTAFAAASGRFELDWRLGALPARSKL
jgi:hypothetical protein